MLSFKKYLPVKKASIAPSVVAITQQIVPSIGPKRTLAAIANVTPGRAKTTQLIMVTTM